MVGRGPNVEAAAVVSTAAEIARWAAQPLAGHRVLVPLQQVPGAVGKGAHPLVRAALLVIDTGRSRRAAAVPA